MSLRQFILASFLALVVSSVPTKADIAPPTEAITKALNEGTIGEAWSGELSFEEAIERLRKIDDLHVQVSWSELELAGIARDSTVEFDLPTETTVRQALRTLFADVGAGFASVTSYLDGPVLHVTTTEAATHKSQTTRTYDVTGIVEAIGRDIEQRTALPEQQTAVAQSGGGGFGGGGGGPNMRAATSTPQLAARGELLDLVHSTVQPAWWTTNGGTTASARFAGPVLVVNAPVMLHDDLATLLEKLKAAL